MKTIARFVLLSLAPWYASATHADIFGSGANPPTPGGQSVVDVIYSDPAAPSGPVSLGLDALPEAIPAKLILNAAPSFGLNTFDLAHVLSFELTLGDATWTEDDLLRFSMTTETNRVRNDLIPTVTSLQYESSPINTPTTPDDPDRGTYLNNNSFSLTIQGADFATGQPFEYLYQESRQTVTIVPPGRGRFRSRAGTDQESMQTVTVVPEPATIRLVLMSVFALPLLRRLRQLNLPIS